MGPAVFLDKEPTGLGSLLAGLICSAIEGYALGVQKREKGVSQNTEILKILSEGNKYVYKCQHQVEDILIRHLDSYQMNQD